MVIRPHCTMSEETGPQGQIDGKPEVKKIENWIHMDAYGPMLFGSEAAWVVKVLVWRKEIWICRQGPQRGNREGSGELINSLIPPPRTPKIYKE